MSHSFSEFGPNSGYIQDLYRLYLTEPTLVGDTWAKFFERYVGPDLGNIPTNGHSKPLNGDSNGHARKILESATTSAATAEISRPQNQDAKPVESNLQKKVFQLIEAFRARGHLKARHNPLAQAVNTLPFVPELQMAYYEFSEAELATDVSCNLNGQTQIPLNKLLRDLPNLYCASVGFEFMHLTNSVEREWICERIESGAWRGSEYTPEEKKALLAQLVAAESLESELHKKYVGSKRFSLQGGETLIPMLQTVVDAAAENALAEIIIGMPHRGRLNVLANIVGKPLADLFTEFEDQSMFSVLGSGDVKYHLGYASKRRAKNGAEIKLELAPNPSHLESVNPVVEGMVRARQDLEHQGDRSKVVPVILHGDAAFIGQGIVFESMNLSRVEGYATGGTVHFIVNNQIGFTTNPDESRSSIYCTDGARAFEVPVFHVNCEDVEAACRVTRLAFEFREQFKRDVVIDLYCYRKYGHNEGDDPSFTQPIMYAEIAKKKSIARIFEEKLIEAGTLSEAESKEIQAEYVRKFQSARQSSAQTTVGDACPVHGRLRIPTPPTGVPAEALRKIGDSLLSYPADFMPHPKLFKILEKRVESLATGKGVDWGFAEGLAFGSLVMEGHGVRLSGQDCGRGTFSQRHLLLSHYEKADRYLPFSVLTNPDKPNSRFEVYNSILSEAAVLGFEFGYASIAKESLVIWEAQFGDFANGAQVIIDQYLASSEAKWNQLSGLVMMLPHGFEGQGPEHSSARLERYLQLCAEGNMVVAYPTRASQHFHLLRRQGLMEIKRPLVVMTPKSLLRHPGAAGDLREFTSGQFETVLENDYGSGEPEHLILLSGKVFYDLDTVLQKDSKARVKVIRIEQLYPFPQFELKKALKGKKYSSVLWVQEEPQNMGAWSYIEPYLRTKLELDPIYCGREVGASPATGSAKKHAAEQQAIVNTALSYVSR